MDINQLTYDQAERMYFNGALPEKQWLLFLQRWTWCAPRFGGTAGLKQDAFWRAHGKDRFMRKMNANRKAAGLKPY